jgi:hypothetical protein
MRLRNSTPRIVNGENSKTSLMADSPGKFGQSRHSDGKGAAIKYGNVAALLQQINGLWLHCRHWI